MVLEARKDGIYSYLGEVPVPHKVMKVNVREVQIHRGRVRLELPDKSVEKDQEQSQSLQNTPRNTAIWIQSASYQITDILSDISPPGLYL